VAEAPRASLGLAFTAGVPQALRVRPAEGSLWRMLVLMATLPLFFQSFHYMIDLPPAYALSKAWPLLTMPFAALALLACRPSHTVLYLALAAYMLVLTPLQSALHLGSSLVEAAAAALRPLPIIYGLSFAGLLWLLRPGLRDVRLAFLLLGFLTFAAFWALWLTMPLSAYRTDPGESQVFFSDPERGLRIVLMTGFAVVAIFWMARRALRTRSLLAAAGVLLGLLTLLTIYKQRLVIASVVAVLGLLVLRSLPARLRLLGFLAGASAALAALVAWSLVVAPRAATSLLGGSLSVRLRTSQLAWDYISEYPSRWLLGVGSTTAQSDITLAELLGFRNFYLTDIGWLGVVMEFGMLGGLLILAALIWMIIAAQRLASQTDDAFTGALADWSLVVLLVTTIYSPVYAPGEIASLSALIWYLTWQRGRTQPGLTPEAPLGRSARPAGAPLPLR